MEPDTTPTISRRGFLHGGAALVAGGILASMPAGRVRAAPQTTRPAAAGGHELPPLPYEASALEPIIDTTTMQIHHGKHHAGYVSKLNSALEGHPELAKLPLEELLADGARRVPEAIRQNVINSGGGHANHSLFWQVLAPRGSGGSPEGKLAEAIRSTFGTQAKLHDALVEAGSKRFGSGWAWLARSADGRLEVFSTANQDSPLMSGKTPIFGIDVWEHAYYLKYQNRRGDYLKAIGELINWPELGRRFEA